MNEQETAAQKTRLFMMLGTGIAALIASYAIGYSGRGGGVSTLAEIVLTAIFLGCMFVAATIALKLNKQNTAK